MASPPLTNREYAYLRVVGEGSSSPVSNELGIGPTNSWSEGDVNPRNNIPRKFMSWQLESGLDDTSPIGEHIEALLEILEAKSDQMQKLANSYMCSIQCVGYFPASGHGLNLELSTLKRLVNLNLNIDYDFYYVSDNGHDLDYL